MARGRERILTRFTQTLYLFIPCSGGILCFVEFSTLAHASVPDTGK